MYILVYELRSFQVVAPSGRENTDHFKTISSAVFLKIKMEYCVQQFIFNVKLFCSNKLKIFVLFNFFDDKLSFLVNVIEITFLH